MVKLKGKYNKKGKGKAKRVKQNDEICLPNTNSRKLNCKIRYSKRVESRFRLQRKKNLWRSYRWWKDGKDIKGAETNILNIVTNEILKLFWNGVTNDFEKQWKFELVIDILGPLRYNMRKMVRMHYKHKARGLCWKRSYFSFKKCSFSIYSLYIWKWLRKNKLYSINHSV